MRRGGPDNITVIAARFEGAGLALAAADSEVGYHVIPSDDPDSGDIPALLPMQHAHTYEESIEQEPIPSAPEPAPPPPAVVIRRSGSPATIAAVGAAILLFLFALYLLLKH